MCCEEKSIFFSNCYRVSPDSAISNSAVPFIAIQSKASLHDASVSSVFNYAGLFWNCTMRGPHVHYFSPYPDMRLSPLNSISSSFSRSRSRSHWVTKLGVVIWTKGWGKIQRDTISGIKNIILSFGGWTWVCRCQYMYMVIFKII